MTAPDDTGRLWKVSGRAGPLGLGIDVQFPYHPGLLAEILKAEIADPLTLLLQKVLHITEFVGDSLLDPGGSAKAGDQISVRRLRQRLATAKAPRKPLPLRVSGVFCTGVLLSYGWWERTGPGANPVGRNDIQRWTYAGFEEWAPSWDFTSEVESGDESFFLGQLGHGDEANSMLVVVVGRRAREIRRGLVPSMQHRKVAAVSVEVTGLLCHRSHLRKRNPALAPIADRWPYDFNYCLLLDSDHHRITEVNEVPDFYSAYLWKCLWATDGVADGTLPRLDDCYLIWEHTDLTKPDAIRYNLDSLQHKEQFLRKEYGALELLQKSSPLIPETPSLSAGSFQRLFGAIGRT
ncbi:hypothetical protein [Nocardia sp. alder85J]|uniref:hypothetical protein n=1 Tax=Nocardia sp. alder85J TaxID=2862949 RepID=UPI001CD4F19C|nr:hypothetical protein [Nocardia sp. alder85J]MCX4098204.1 hypothetical protein [Nocardia sp. alder85J]